MQRTLTLLSLLCASLVSPRADAELATKGWPDLHEAANNAIDLSHVSGAGHIEVVRILLKKGAPINARAADETTALHWAVFRGGPVELVELLMDHGADVNARDDKGRTPLDWAQMRLSLRRRDAALDIHREAREEIARLLASKGGISGGLPGRE